MSNLSPPIQQLVQKYQQAFFAAKQKKGEATIHVDEIASKVASFYEKLRAIVDWKEEHLIRRGAIERVLKRRLISELPGFNLITDLKPKEMAEPLVLELIRGGHFSNDTIPQSKLVDVENVLKKYIFILENKRSLMLRNKQSLMLRNNKPANSGAKAKINFYNWLLEIAACEIEEILDPPLKESALILTMTELMDERIQVNPKTFLSEEEKRIQIYIAVHRTLFHLDAPIISYHLLRYFYPDWSGPDKTAFDQIARSIYLAWEDIEKKLNHPLGNQFFKICEGYDTLYLVLGDVLENFAEKPSEALAQISEIGILNNLAVGAYNKRLRTLKSRLFRMAVYSTLSIFLASAVSLFIVEVPLARLLYGKFSPLSIAVDIFFPTILMFALVASVKLPSEKNLQVVLEELKKIVYRGEIKDVYEVKKLEKRGFIVNFIITFFYTLASFISLALTVLIFYLATVPLTSVILDTMNVAIIVFAGLIIRRRAKELTVEKEKANFWQFSLDILSVPVAKMGKWLSGKWREYNLASVFFIALIDMPFQSFIRFVESWSTFLKERKAEIH